MKEKSLYDELKNKGYTRREFLKFCGIMSAMLGLQTSGMAQVVDALQKKPRKPVLWYHFQECTCCSESFIRASHPLVSQILFDMISLEYTDTLMAAAGEQAEALREKAIKENFGNYIMIVEGAIPLQTRPMLNPYTKYFRENRSSMYKAARPSPTSWPESLHTS